MKKRCQQCTQAFEYNFAGGTPPLSNGLQGTHDLPILPPTNSVFIDGFIYCKTTLVGVGAGLNFGNTNGNFHFGTNLTIADFSQGVAVALNQVVVLTPPAGAYMNIGGFPLQITIATADVTAGIILFVINYNSFE